MAASWRTAGWHKYKSRRQAVFGKVIRELHGMKTTTGHHLDIQMRQRDWLPCGIVRHSTLWVKPKLVANFEFLEWTDSNHVRHIKFVGLRSDKDPLDVIRE